MGTPLGLKYIPYTYMDPLGLLSPLVKAMEVLMEREYDSFTSCSRFAAGRPRIRRSSHDARGAITEMKRQQKLAAAEKEMFQSA